MDLLVIMGGFFCHDRNVCELMTDFGCVCVEGKCTVKLLICRCGERWGGYQCYVYDLHCG